MCIRDSHWTVQSHDAAKNGDGVRIVGQLVGGQNIAGTSDSTGISMLNGNGRRLAKLLHQAQSRIGVIEIAE